MKSKIITSILGALSAVALSYGMARADTVNYGNITLSGGYQAGHFEQLWDLTKCDLVLSFTVDLRGMKDIAGAHAWSEIGVRTQGSGDFNPAAGTGVWLATDYDWTVGTFAPDPAGAPTLDNDDKLILQKVGGQGEGSYNLPSVPPNPWANYGVWFDRDGVDPWQALMWGMINGKTYNTLGLYDVVITLHATGPSSGTAFMTVNGVSQGFYDLGWHAGAPDLYPAGMTFTGDMTKMQVFYGLYGYGAPPSVTFENITAVQGCLGMIVIDGCDTGVVDQVLPDGSTISGRIAECAKNASNHGKFVSCVADLTNGLKKLGVITGEQKGAIQSCAGQSSIGK